MRGVAAESVVTTLVVKLTKIARQLDGERGPLELFGIFLREDAPAMGPPDRRPLGRSRPLGRPSLYVGLASKGSSKAESHPPIARRPPQKRDPCLETILDEVRTNSSRFRFDPSRSPTWPSMRPMSSWRPPVCAERCRRKTQVVSGPTDGPLSSGEAGSGAVGSEPVIEGHEVEMASSRRVHGPRDQDANCIDRISKCHKRNRHLSRRSCNVERCNASNVDP